MTPDTDTTTSDVLLRAADYIEEHGWYQGDYEDENGCVCVLGAIRHACRAKSVDWDAHFDAISKLNHWLIQYQLVEPWQSAAVWNDKQDRTKEQVLAVLRKVARGETN